jgi:hypothetical protein
MKIARSHRRAKLSIILFLALRCILVIAEITVDNTSSVNRFCPPLRLLEFALFSYVMRQ